MPVRHWTCSPPGGPVTLEAVVGRTLTTLVIGVIIGFFVMIWLLVSCLRVIF